MIACLSNHLVLPRRSNINMALWELQAWKEKDSIPCEELASNPYFYFKKLKHARRRLVQCIIELLQKYPNLYMRQDTIADLIGISRSYCNTLLGELERDGVIVTWDRHKCSSFYKLSSFMLRQDVLFAISKAMAVFSGFLEQVLEATQKKLTLVMNTLSIKNLRASVSNVQCNNPVGKSLGNLLTNLLSPKTEKANTHKGREVDVFTPKLLPYKEQLIEEIEKAFKLRGNAQELRAMSLEELEHIVKNHPLMKKE